MIKRDRTRQNGGRRRWWRGWVVWALAVEAGAWLVCSLAVVVTSVRAYAIPTGSMAPTLNPGDRVGVHLAGRQPRRGEVWVLRMPPASRQTPNQAVKRIIGLPGETVEVASGRVLIDGKPLAEPYGPGPMGYTMPPLKLGEDEYFVLGDNRNASFDSHAWGPVPLDHMVGPVKVLYWPPGRAGGL